MAITPPVMTTPSPASANARPRRGSPAAIDPLAAAESVVEIDDAATEAAIGVSAAFCGIDASTLPSAVASSAP
jgi:hypothetical protein